MTAKEFFEDWLSNAGLHLADYRKALGGKWAVKIGADDSGCWLLVTVADFNGHPGWYYAISKVRGFAASVRRLRD